MRQALALAAILLASCSATPSSTSLDTQTEVGAIVETALTHSSVVTYLHPEVPGRLPITVAFRSPDGPSSLEATLFGQPVRVVAVTPDVQAVVLGIRIRGDQASVALEYAPEGLIGDINLERRGSTWVVKSSQMREQRPNNFSNVWLFRCNNSPTSALRVGLIQALGGSGSSEANQ